MIARKNYLYYNSTTTIDDDDHQNTTKESKPIGKVEMIEMIYRARNPGNRN